MYRKKDLGNGKDRRNNEGKVTKERLIRASETLRQFKNARRSFDQRLDEEEEFWRLRHWKYIQSGSQTEKKLQPTSAWLFNSISNRHADMMDKIPKCTCMPREAGDQADAVLLSKIIPVVTERCAFGQTYSDNTWYKLKHGVSAYGVFWNNSLDGGVGDIDVRGINLRNIYWEPGVTDIQDSSDLFILNLCDPESLAEKYPVLKRSDADPELVTLRTGREKAVVTDWYYKVDTPDGRILNYCKYCGDTVLFSSEDMPEYESRGWYDHGMYPVVLDVLYPIEGECGGFGMIAVGKDPQMYIDRLDSNIMEYVDWASRVRFWAKKSLGVNEEDFCDLDRRIVEVEGDIDEEKLKQITVTPLDDIVVDIKRMKIDELKETSGNRDVSQGSSERVIAASAIMALQEAGSKGSRDALAGSYRAYEKVVCLIVELIRQFYDEPRCFRITGDDGRDEYLSYSNAGITEKFEKSNGIVIYRKPIFDIVIGAGGRSPSERSERNNFAKSLYDSGAFLPENSKQALMMLELMEFDGIEKIRSMIRENAADTEK